MASGAPEFDVVVVGLGPVGAAAANVLGQAGHTVLVVEQNDGAGLRPRAGGLDDENLRLLQSVGLVDAFMRTSNNMTMGPDRFGPVDLAPATGRVSRNGAGYGYRGFYQPKFEEILRAGAARFRNVESRLSTRCVGVSQTADCAAVELQRDLGSWERTAGDEAVYVSKPEGEPYTVRCRYVIGCDGARSSVRKAMDTRFIDLGFDERWWACDLKLVDENKVWGRKLPHRRASVDMDRAWGLIPLWRITDKGPNQGRHVRFEFQVEPADELTYGGDLQSVDRVRALVSNWLDPEDYELVRFAMYHFRGLSAERWRDGRLLLAGDACHTMPPYMGQGLNQGFKDIANVSWKLSAVMRGEVDAALLDTYQEERSPISTMVTKASMMIGKRMSALRAKRRAQGKSGEIGMASARGKAGGKGGASTKKGVPDLKLDMSVMASRIKQRTDTAKPYPPLVANGPDGLTGLTFPQVRVRRRGAAAAALLDDCLPSAQAGRPACWALIAVSRRGAAPALSAGAAALLRRAGAAVLPLALTPAGGQEADPGCEHTIVAGDYKGFEKLAPLAALVRPDRFVLGAAPLAHADELAHELRRYLAVASPGKL